MRSLTVSPGSAVLGTIHNLSFYQTLMREARAAILEGRYLAWKQGFLTEYGG